MNAFLTRPVLEHAMSVHASTAPSEVSKMVSYPTSSFALCRPSLPCPADVVLGWMYPDIHQSVTHFPDLLVASGKRIFNDYWR